ncbi:MAG: alanine--tRNA ligase [Candidatus Babeliaceae bacterium]|jgi:alanyl-tRNA synthetase
MKSIEIRKKFFDFFIKKGHERVASSSLIPAEDPTLLFANAGMNQFKDVFLGKEKRSYTRAVSIQKCIRAGGKHNDLENVGFTERHLTFFEMMGNFSFGDYFKKEALQYAWEFLTIDLGLSQEKLYVTVFTDDQEAYDIWHNIIGLSTERIFRLGAADNFWQMGDIGPCGPCSEIYFDRGADHGCRTKECAPGCSCDRFLEIWNNVFMQFDRSKDQAGNYHDALLKQTGVDTGMGLERLSLVMQHKESVFEVDLFASIIHATEKLTGHDYSSATPEIKAAFRVIADHIRSSTFAITDGCIPSNEGRGYVVRKIIRRAALFAQKLSGDNFFPELVFTIAHAMGDIYPELVAQKDFVHTLITGEIEKFSHNLIHGQTILKKYFEEDNKNKIISGAQAFKLYDTYGFPVELTKIIAHDNGYTVDVINFEKEMERQRVQSGKKNIDTQATTITVSGEEHSEFTGYSELETATHITKILCNGVEVEEIPAGEKCWIITAQSPFYVECGGQISDQGWIIKSHDRMPVLNLKKMGNAIAVELQSTELLRVGDALTLLVDKELRQNAAKNHTATHLLQAALVNIFGKHIKQSGSLVAPDYLRFDFTHQETLSAEQIKNIEALVNKKIQENIRVQVTVSTYKNAVDRGVTAFFGEKYNPENVRVVEVPGFSAELCGGTHVTATGDIGCFKITEVTTLSAGNRRIVAVTGPQAVALFQESYATIKSLSQEFKVKPADVLEAIEKQQALLKSSQADNKQLKKELIKKNSAEWLQKTEIINNIPVCYVTIEPALASELREIAQQLAQKQSGVYCLVAHSQFLILISPQFTVINGKALIEWLKSQGLNCGGSATMIQGSGAITDSFKAMFMAWVKAQS